jgi:hypothetical protein
VILVLPDDAEMSDGRAMSFTSAGNARRRGDVLAAVEIGLLLMQSDKDVRAAGMPLRNVRRDHIADRAAGIQSEHAERAQKQEDASFHAASSSQEHAARAWRD